MAPPLFRAKRLTWVVAGGVSLLLLGLVAAQVDVAALAAAQISWPLAGAALALLFGENLIAALRTHLLADRRGGFVAAMEVTAWHSVWLLALPVRLGEVAWVVVMRRTYGWSTTTAVACALVQRLLDAAVIAACLLLSMLMVFGLSGDGAWLLAALAAGLCLLALVGALSLHLWLRLAAGMVVRAGRPRGWRRRLLRHLRQGRRWLESARHRRIMRLCLLPTALLWLGVFTAFWLVGRAVGLDGAYAELLFAAAGGSLATALPVQSIGGLGLLEAGLTGILAGLGAPAAKAALAALFFRCAIWVSVGLFWLFSAAVGALVGGKAGPAPASRQG